MRITTLLLSLLMSAGYLQADLIFSNFATANPLPPSGYITGSGRTISNASNQIGLAFSFQALSYTTVLTRIDLAVTFLGGTITTAPPIEIGIAADSGGAPGTILEEQTLHLLAATDINGNYLPEIVTLTPNTADILLANQTYWVFAEEGDLVNRDQSLRWNYNPTFNIGPNSVLSLDTSRIPAVETWASGSTSQGALQVEGNLAAPEPGTIGLLSSGLLFAGFAVRRRRSNN